MRWSNYCINDKVCVLKLKVQGIEVKSDVKSYTYSIHIVTWSKRMYIDWVKRELGRLNQQNINAQFGLYLRESG